MDRRCCSWLAQMVPFSAPTRRRGSGLIKEHPIDAPRISDFEASNHSQHHLQRPGRIHDPLREVRGCVGERRGRFALLRKCAGVFSGLRARHLDREADEGFVHEQKQSVEEREYG